jgi:shikimate kinase
MGPVIWLYASAAETLERIKDTAKRPLLDVDNPEEKIEILIGKRKKCYGLADVKIDTSSLTPEETAERIIKFLGEYSWQT